MRIEEATILNALKKRPIDPLRALYEGSAQLIHPMRATLRAFRPKIQISFSKGHYLVKTATSPDDLLEVIKLRYQIFHREFMNKRFPYGFDIDALDGLADHLMIIDSRTGAVVGTYRLICSSFSPKFYSQSEFVLGKLTQLPGVKLELSRACISRDYRTGAVIHLLWRGISAYLRETGAQYLFGCASVKTVDAFEASLLYAYLSTNGFTREEYEVAPLPSFQVPPFTSYVEHILRHWDDASIQACKAMLPALFQSYLKMGAKVCSAPAFDAEFKCMDFLTILNAEQLTKPFERKYMAC